MKVTVTFDDNCIGDAHERSPDEIALIHACIAATIDLFGQHGGHLPGARKSSTDNDWQWEDANWKICYRVIDKSKKSRNVVIGEVRLKWTK